MNVCLSAWWYCWLVYVAGQLYWVLWLSSIYLPPSEDSMLEQAMFGPGFEMKHLHLLYVLILVVMGNFKGHALPGSCFFIFGDLVDYKVHSEICLQKARNGLLTLIPKHYSVNWNFGRNRISWNGFNWWVTLFCVLFCAFLGYFHMQRENSISKQKIAKISILLKIPEYLF